MASKDCNDMKESGARVTAAWIGSIAWQETSERLDSLLARGEPITAHPMSQGFEAEVTELRASEARYVLKIWNKESEPDIGFQFRLLQALAARGVGVSVPLGWGTTPAGHAVLLTTFDGTAPAGMNAKRVGAIARLLSDVHDLPSSALSVLQLPQYDLLGYFFPGIGEHPDLEQAAQALVQAAGVRHDRLIHGDFHLANLVEAEGGFTVIDWTNAQLGDARYDFAWAYVLLQMYAMRSAGAFRKAYLALQGTPVEAELPAFEALAILRWLLLYRKGGVPAGKDSVERARALLALHPLTQGLLP